MRKPEALMSGFTKLFSAITSSSIWNEDDHTRIVWITMLAMADPRGVVHASIGGLAHTARVEREECEKAINVLLSPDPDSRSPDFEGRRIEKIDGGFLLLNYAKYREARSDDERRIYMKEYMQQYRKKNVNNRKQKLTRVKRGKPPLAQAEEEAEGDNKKAALSPQEFLDSLKTEKAFEGIDIEREMEKAIFWCKNNGRKFTQRFFTNWLNKADRVLPVNGTKKLQTAAEYRAEMDRLAREEEANAR